MVRLTGGLDMTIVVDWDVKPQTEQTNYIVLVWIKIYCLRIYLSLRTPRND